MMVLLYIAIAVVLRLLPHPWDLTPVGAMFLFAGARCSTKIQGILVPLAALMISDIFVVYVLYGGRYSWISPVTWLGFTAVACLGFLLRERFNALATGGLALAGAVLFYLISNFGVWVSSGMYPHTGAGLLACYVAALPFLRNSVAGNLGYSLLMFGSFELIRRWSMRKNAGFNTASGY